MAYTLDQIKTWLQSNPVLDDMQVDKFREAMHRGVMDGARLTKIVEVVELLDFDLSHIDIYKALTNAICNFLLDDDDVSEAAGELDWVSVSLGDTFVTKLQASTLPNKVKKHILLEVDSRAVNILSTDLLNAITLAKQ